MLLGGGWGLGGPIGKLFRVARACAVYVSSQRRAKLSERGFAFPVCAPEASPFPFAPQGPFQLQLALLSEKNSTTVFFAFTFSVVCHHF